MTFLGVYLITSGRPRGKEYMDDDDDDEEEEATIGLIDEEYHDEPIEGPATDGGRTGRKLTLETTFDGKAASPSASRRGSLQVEDIPSLTPHRLRTPSPARRPSVAFGKTPTPARDPERESLLSNPWMTSQERLPTEPLSRIETTQSTPPGFIPSSIFTPVVNQLETPVRQRPSSRPSSPPKTDPHPSIAGLSRHSISRILPGPLISPLSSSLSAVVADSLRRGVGLIDGTPTRRKSTRLGGGLQRARTTRVTRSNTREDRDPDRLLRSAEPHDGPAEDNTDGSGERKKRMRSFSDALGWLRSGEGRKKRNDGDENGVGDVDGGTENTPDPGPSTEPVG